MALVITDTTYSGQVASDFIVRAVMGSETVKKGLVYVKDKIKKKYTIPRISVSNVVQARAATPASQGSITADGKTLDPKDYMIYIEFNPRDFEDHWFAEELDDKLLDRALPATVESALIQEILKAHDAFHEVAMWQSVEASATPYTYYDGFIEKLVGDANTILIDTPVALTSANILAKMELIKQAILPELRSNPNLKFVMGYADWDKYETAMQGLALDTINATLAVKKQYSGIPIEVVGGVPENTIMAGVFAPEMSSNFWVGLNSSDDMTEVKLAQLQANSELWFIKMLFKVDVQIGFAEEVVLYHV